MFTGSEIFISLNWDVISRILSKDKKPSRPTGRDDSIAMPDALWEVVQKCWREPGERVTMREVVREVEGLVG